MSTKFLTVSVIIPTHNRVKSILRTLEALCVQTYPFEFIELIVVADGCTDETMEILKSYKAPFAFNIIEQEGQGAAAARNTGAANAEGNLLLFLDDDVVPTPGLIEAHVCVHQCNPGQAVMGPYPPVLQGKTDFFHILTRLWWGEKFQSMRQLGHRYTYRDMLSGNLSLESKIFHSVGGFDASIKNCGGEDYELGVRLIKAGIPFDLIADAQAYHYEHETTNLDRSFQRSLQEGRADVQIGRRHPELKLTLRLAYFETHSSSKIQRVVKIALEHPGIGDYLAAHLRPVLTLLEKLRMRGFWKRLFKGLSGYWYLRGVKEELGDRRALANFLQSAHVQSDESNYEIEIDLSHGIEAAMHCLDEERPTSVRIRHGHHIVGRIQEKPGAEKLRGIHLVSILANHFAWPLAKAIAMENALGVANDEKKMNPTFIQ